MSLAELSCRFHPWTLGGAEGLREISRGRPISP